MLLALLRIVGLVFLVVLIVSLVRSFLGAGSGSGSRGGGTGIGGLLKRDPGFKCKTCRHAGKVFDDGALCRYGNRETFKNPTHIANCMDYERK